MKHVWSRENDAKPSNRTKKVVTNISEGKIEIKSLSSFPYYKNTGGVMSFQQLVVVIIPGGGGTPQLHHKSA